MAIYMRNSLGIYRQAHMKLSSQKFTPDHFYINFNLRCQERYHSFELIIKEMGEEVGLPPCLMARFVLKSFIHVYPDGSLNLPNDNSVDLSSEFDSESSNGKTSKAITSRITKLLRDPDILQAIDPYLHSNILYCVQNDLLTSPLTDEYRHQIGIEKEVYLHQRLSDMGILFHSEADMREAGYSKTPDALLAYPVEIDGRIVNWIESKALFCDFPTHQTYLRDQYWPYYNRFGPGLVIYWYGFLDEISSERDRETGISVMDRLPDVINKIKY